MILAVEGLAFGYGRRRVGAGIDLGLASGEVVCLLGPNGGGKTTLLKTVMGLLPPLTGQVRLAGQDVTRLSRAATARLVGYVPQAGAGIFPFTIYESVLMGRTAWMGAFAGPARRDHAATAAAIAAMGIAHLSERFYTQVSGGERQLALIARALAQEPRLLIMDEPTASLDFGNQMRVLREIAALAKRGPAVLFTTHDPNHALMVADRVAILGEGRIKALGRTRETVTTANLADAYGVAVDVVEVTRGDGSRARVCVPGLAG